MLNLRRPSSIQSLSIDEDDSTSVVVFPSFKLLLSNLASSHNKAIISSTDAASPPASRSNSLNAEMS